MTTTINGSSPSITFSDGSAQTSATRPFLNRLINGNFVIDQRNAGALINPAVSGYTVDRWYYFQSQTSKGTIGQNAGSVTPPVGFSNYLGFTSTSAYSIISTDQFFIQQPIEGFNFADLGFGSANAKTVTLSFQVYSSLTGTFGGAFQNSAATRNYPFTYTISTANTWTSVSVTIAGDTTGTWIGATNGTGAKVVFSLGSGTAQSATAGAWTGTSFITSATGATSVVGTNGATFYITGVQLEVGSTATSFDYRPYGTELALCYRYYYKIFPADGSSKGYGNGTSINTTNIYNTVPSPVTMRVNPTLETTGTASDYGIVRGGGTNTVCSSVPTISDQSHRFMLQVNASLSSGLIDGYSGWLRTNSASSYLGFNAEL